MIQHRYAFAMIMWEIGSRETPYKGAESEVIKLCVNDGEREKDLEDCPPEYMDLIKSCWDQDPQQRPSAKEIIAELERIKKQVS